jgi:hypothetical protein
MFAAIARPAFVLVVVTALALALRVTVWPRSVTPQDSAATAVGPAPDGPLAPRAVPDSLVRLVAALDVFRQARSSSTVPFDPRTTQGGGAPPPPPGPPHPTLALAGIIFGRHPAALVDGIPGSEGTRVIHAGERVGELLVRSIAREQVVIAGRDTVWTLRVRTPIP